ncbi:MAG: DUF3349 domain-containing protein [Microbacterium sp.]
MTENQGLIDRIVNWLRAGYPEGLPQNDYLPLVALLSNRLTTEEIEAVVRLAKEGSAPTDEIDIRALIVQVKNALPDDDDVRRVQARLAAAGWPLEFTTPVAS